ncbi:MAG TPA: HIT family protein [Rhizomicrobium sp.]|jgi:diadenosine tetraphosphate (Ap4A) HIT family hydrolase|nr:HIT family protein [Rhizomicrobium sp.]
MREFDLHPRLAADTAFVADWTLCRLLLMNDARYPWLILVPRRAAALEIFDLNPEDREILIAEIALACERLKHFSQAAKINVGALGNLVPQLHIHIVARNPGDAAWPGPVWGQGVAIPYEPEAVRDVVARLSSML